MNEAKHPRTMRVKPRGISLPGLSLRIRPRPHHAGSQGQSLLMSVKADWNLDA